MSVDYHVSFGPVRWWLSGTSRCPQQQWIGGVLLKSTYHHLWWGCRVLLGSQKFNRVSLSLKVQRKQWTEHATRTAPEFNIYIPVTPIFHFKSENKWLKLLTWRKRHWKLLWKARCYKSREISDYSKPTWTQQVTYISNMHPSLCMLEYKMVRQKSVFTKRLGQCQERKQERTRLFDESPQKSRWKAKL